MGLSYVAKDWNATLGGRWVDEFFWTNSPTFRGTVESFTTFDLSVNYAIDESWTVGVNAMNLLDDKHWEAWGTDIIRRRVLGHVAYSW